MLDFMDPGLMGYLWVIAPIVALVAAVHAVRTGRQLYWVWIILLFPLAGALVYFLAEVVPHMGPMRVGNPLPALLDWLIPGREYARLVDNRERSDTVANRLALAEYHVRQSEYPEALQLYESCLTGVYKDDPGIHIELARVHFLAGNHEEAKLLLEATMAQAPLHEPQKRDFLLGRIAEEQGDKQRALAIFERMRTSGPITEEARVRLALLFEERGEQQRAHELYKDVVRRMRTANNNYRREQREWLLKARQRLKQQAS